MYAGREGHRVHGAEGIGLVFFHDLQHARTREARIKPEEAADLFAGLDDSDMEIAAAIDEALTISRALDDSLEDDVD